MITSTYQKIVDEITSWPGVTTSGNQLQGVEFRFGPAQLGHLHSFEVAHIPVSTDLYSVLIRSGTARPHPVFTNSNWVEVPMSTPEDGERLIALFRLNYNLFQQRPAA
jgi:hypothetical protein